MTSLSSPPLALPVEARADGPWTITTDERRLLNFGGYGVLILGGAHPTVVAAVREQLNLLPTGSVTLQHNADAMARASLSSTLPGELSEVAFAVTGAEAVELALRLARLNRCTSLITTRGGFHGRTLGALSVNGSDRLRRPYLPLLPDVTVVEYGDADAVQTALANTDGRAAVIVEPVQGEAGVVVPPSGYLAAVAEACGHYGALLIVDEVQTGLGRLATWWGINRENVVPDMLVCGKALGGGVVPVSAIAAQPTVFAPFRRDPRHASSTFGGYPLGAAAVRATIDVLRRDQIVERAEETGQQVAAILRAHCTPAAADSAVREIRGIGLLHGIEFDHPQTAAAFAKGLIEHGVIPSYSQAAAATVRLTPPALLGREELEAFGSGVVAAITMAHEVAATRRERQRKGAATG